MVLGETDKTASDIQARSFMARTLGQNVKERQAEGEKHKWQLKNQSSIMHENYEEGNHQQCKEKMGNTNGSSYALQDL